MPRINGHALATGMVVSATAPLPDVLRALNEEVKKYATSRHVFSFEIESWLEGQDKYGEEYYGCPVTNEEYFAEGSGLLNSAVDWLNRSCPAGVTFGKKDGNWGFWYS